MKFACRLLFLCALLCGASSAYAVVDTKKYAAEIARVEAFLSTLTTIEAGFSQVAPSGDLSSGVFYFQRPGKMRWQYTKPQPLLLVSNGEIITYFDPELGQVNYVDINDTLAGFLTKETLKLNTKATELTAFDTKYGTIRATIRQRQAPENGTLTLEFTDKPLVLRQMIISDAAGNRTRVALAGAVYGKKLDKSLFIFKDPRGAAPKRKAGSFR